MKVTLNWLNDFVNLSKYSIDEIAQKFTMIGYEVEEILTPGSGMDKVIVGQIEKIEKHPNADKLQICKISLGNGNKVQIITAATNVFEGAIVPCALEGADLPCGIKIKETNMRGELSQGMLCSGEEICIDNSVYNGAETDGIMILDDTAVLGQTIAEFLGFDDVIFDVKVLANRPDCQSIVGLARELAAGFNIEFNAPNLNFSTQDISCPLSVDIKTSNCTDYLVCAISDIDLKESPKIIQQRLKLLGINTRNNVIDLTNYVLIEMGQPLHAFDYDKIKNHKIIVRNATENEKIDTLDHKTYELNDSTTVISDSENAIGIAGVIGGTEFSVNESTKNIAIESAIFDRVNIRRTARELDIHTDAALRYERGVEPISAALGLKRFLALIDMYKIGKISNKIMGLDNINASTRVIAFRKSELIRKLGIDIEKDSIKDILSRLEIETEISDDIVCKIPAIRNDLVNSDDIIEEIIRFYGFDKLISTKLENTQQTVSHTAENLGLPIKVTDYMLSTGAYEVKTYTFHSPLDYDKLLLNKNNILRDYVQISNPLSLNYSVMRTQMVSSMLNVAKLNTARKNFDINIFEIGKVFVNNGANLPIEKNILSYLSTDKKTDFFKIKSIIEALSVKFGAPFNYKEANIGYLHPNISAEIWAYNKRIGLVGKIHPKVQKNFEIKNDVYYFEVDLDIIPNRKVKKIKALPKFPSAARDLAVIVAEDVKVGDIIECIKRTGGGLLETIELFDIYQGEQVSAGYKSVAVNLVFRKQDGTLNQEEINEIITKILNELAKKFSAKLR